MAQTAKPCSFRLPIPSLELRRNPLELCIILNLQTNKHISHVWKYRILLRIDVCEYPERTPKHADIIAIQLNAIKRLVLHSHFQDVLMNKFNPLSLLITVS